ncbi:hypothetical protein N510_000818 [Firmicutes bacterium ASF500]|nr:hypothetical protein N510_000818 [Firmicutes bacterium ASF500]
MEAPPIVWTEVSTIEELCDAGGSSESIRLTADLTVTASDLQFYTCWTPTTLDANGRHIRIEAGGCFSFSGNSGDPVVIQGTGGEEGLFQVSPGGELELWDLDASQYTGTLVRQEEGGWLIEGDITAAPEQIVYAQAPVLRPRFTGFAALPLGLSQEELAARLPDTEVFASFQGQQSMMFSLPASQLAWDIEENWADISAGRRTLLHARLSGPVSVEDWFESGLTPTLFAPITCELATLVDSAAIGQIIAHHTTQGSSYELHFLFPDRVQPEGLPLSEERGPTCVELTLDEGETWLSVMADEEGLYTDLLYATLRNGRDKKPWASVGIYQMETSYSVRAWAEYEGEGYTYRLYTDTLELSPNGAYVDPGPGGSRGGTVAIIPDPPAPAQPDPAPRPSGGSRPQKPVRSPVRSAVTAARLKGISICLQWLLQNA